MSRFKQISLGKIVEITNGFAFSSDCFNSDQRGYPLLTPANFYEEGGFRDRGKRQVWFDGTIRQEYLLPARSLAVVMTEQAAGLLGAAAITPSVGPRYLHNQRLARIEPLDANSTCIQYIYWTLAWWKTRKQISIQAGGTKVRHSSVNQLRRVEVPLHSVEVQRAIAIVATDFEKELIAVMHSLRLKKLLLSNLTKEIFSGSRRFDQKVEFAKKTLGSVVLINQATLSEATDESFELEYIDLTAAKSNMPFENASRYKFGESPSRARRMAGKDDVLYSTVRPNLGGHFRIECDVSNLIVSTGFAVLTPRDREDSCFVEAMVTSDIFLGKVMKRTGGSNYPAVGASDLASISLQMPCCSVERRKVGEVYCHLNSEVKLLNRLCSALQKQQRGVMERLLTGEVTIPNHVVERLNAEAEQEERERSLPFPGSPRPASGRGAGGEGLSRNPERGTQS